jgi:hypothetical protein
MADSFVLDGSYSTTPAVGNPSGIGAITAPLTESLQLTQKHYDTIPLGADAPAAINFGGVVNAHVVVLKATGGKVRVRATSTDGALQAIPVDDLIIIISRTVPITAIDLTRVAGVLTLVDVFLGQITP